MVVSIIALICIPHMNLIGMRIHMKKYLIIIILTDMEMTYISIRI